MTPEPDGMETVTEAEYRALLHDARDFVAALARDDPRAHSVGPGCRPLDAHDLELFERQRAIVIDLWNTVPGLLRAGNAELVRSRLLEMIGEQGYPLTDVRNDWDELTPVSSAALDGFGRNLQDLDPKLYTADDSQIGPLLQRLAPDLTPVTPP